MKKPSKVVIAVLLFSLLILAGGYLLGIELASSTTVEVPGSEGDTEPVFWMVILVVISLISIGFHFLLRLKKKSMEESGAKTEDERMFEPFYGADLKERLGVVVSVALLGSLPLVNIHTLFGDTAPPWNSVIVGGSATLLLMLVGFYAVILFKQSREFYDRHELTLIPVVFFILVLSSIYYAMSLEEFTMPAQVRNWSIAVSIYSIAAIIVGVKLLLSANRTIFDKKAKAEEELNFASEVQQQFLNDRLVDTDVISAFGTSMAARQVGGDFLYLEELQDQSVVAAVGDVSGHSFGAGLIMSMLITMTEDHIQFIKSPKGLMENLNRKLLKQPKRNLFATMGCIQLYEDKATLWNAGHMPVLKYSQSEKDITKIQPPGFALGMTNRAKYKTTEVDLTRGDFLVLYSDGLVETRDKDGQIRDEEHFTATVKLALEKESTCKSVAKTIVESVLEDDFSDYPEDDLTIVVIHKKG